MVLNLKLTTAFKILHESFDNLVYSYVFILLTEGFVRSYIRVSAIVSVHCKLAMVNQADHN
jgi:hypothetical protein